MSLLMTVYLIYLSLSIVFTYLVGANLHQNGRVFLVEAFHGDEKMANSINQLLLTGFYLVNFGLVSLFLSFGGHPENNLIAAMEYLTFKFGVVLIVLGGMHFFNMRNIANIRAKGKAAPVAL